VVHRLLLYHLDSINLIASFEGKYVCIGLTVIEIHTLQRMVEGEYVHGVQKWDGKCPRKGNVHRKISDTLQCTGNESAPIQLAQCRFSGLATSNV